MKNLVIVLLGLGVAAGVLWYRLDKAPAPEAEQPAESTASSRLPGLTRPGAEQLAPVEIGRKTDTAIAAPILATAPSPEDLTKRAVARQSIMALHPDLATELELTPEETASFFDLLARQQVESAAATDARSRRIMEESADAEQAAMLDGKFAKWEQYQDDELGRDQIEQLQNVLNSQGIGIGEVLTSRLAEAIAAEQKRLNLEPMDSPQAHSRDPAETLQLQLQGAASSNRQLIQAASRYLSPAQLAIYEQQLQQRVKVMRRKLRIMERNGAQ